MKLAFLLALTTPVAGLACGPFFYPAPPTLDHYPERLPGKTALELLLETQPPVAKKMTFDELEDEVRELASKLPALPPAEARKRIAAAQQHNRDGQYRKRFGNALLDMEDLVAAGGAQDRGAAAYITERMKDMAWDNGIMKRRLPQGTLIFGGKPLKERQAEWDAELEQTAGVLREGTRTASPALRPHWLVLAGAWQFQHVRFTEAEAIFAEIVRTYPRHPRAEIAQLMLLRVAMEVDEDVPDEKRTEEGKAKVEKAFASFEEAWPQSRFRADLPLWKAGWRFERHDFRESIRLLIEPLEKSDRPDIKRRAARQLDACLEYLVPVGEDPDPKVPRFPLEEVARSPLASLAVVYHYLDEASRTELVGREGDGDQEILDHYLLQMLRLRGEGQTVLPLLAKTLASQPPAARDPWRTRYLAVLAWASTQAGDHRQAVQLCEVAGADGRASDDLVFVKAVALQRAGELEKAAAAYTDLRARFPTSPLLRDAAFRLAAVRRDLHQEAGAITELITTLTTPPPPDAPEREIGPGEELPPAPLPDLHMDSELQQWLDHLLHFAPLPELEKALAGLPADSDWALCLRQMLRWRLLAQENFAEARKYAPPASDAPPSDDPKNLGRVELTGEKWQSALARLEKLRTPAPPGGQAERALALANAWQAVRCQFIWPRRSFQRVDRYDENLHDFDRLAHNAVFAGLPYPAVVRELESRDELQHALKHWLAAAEAAPGSAAAAQSLARANTALHRIAIRSAWHEGRAFETNAAAQSRTLFDRLRKEHPKAPETPLAVWWSFPAPAELHTYEGPDYELERAVLDAFRPLVSKEESRARPDEIQGNLLEPRRALENLSAQAGEWDERRLLTELAAIRKGFLPAFADSEGALLINDLDDLTLFLHEPKLTPEARAAYFRIRLSNEAPSVEEPDLQAWRDYLGFLALVREQGPIDSATDLPARRPMTQRMREFLQKYPKSHKREAAMARLAIAAVRESHGHAGVVYSAEWDRSTVAVSDPRPEKAAAAREALATYEREFPKGRYAAEIRFWSGVAAMDAGDYTKGLPILVAALDSRTEPDLHLDAALNLAAFFLRFLEEPAIRPAWLTAMRTSPAAQQKLFQFMHRDSPGTELIYLEDYLRANL